jgi:membrane associated rhomboid family serine protease
MARSPAVVEAKMMVRQPSPGAIAGSALVCAPFAALLGELGAIAVDSIAGDLLDLGVVDLLLVGGTSALLGALGWWVWCRTLPSERWVRLGENSLEAPQSLFSRRQLRIRYADITSIGGPDPGSPPPEGLGGLVIGVGDRFPILIRTSDLVGSPPILSVLDALRRRVRALPGGDRALEAIDRRERVWARIEGSRSRTGLVIAGLLIALWIHSSLFSPPDDPLADLMAKAGVARWMFPDGGLFRLFSAPLFSINLMHAAGNTIWIVVLFSCLEPLVGRARVLVVFVVGAIAGAAAYAALDPSRISVGASGGTMALLGMLAAVRVLRRHELPAILRFPPVLFVGILAIEGSYWWINPQARVLPHVAALACGFCLTAVALRSAGDLGETRSPRWLAAAALGLSMLMFFGGVRAFGYFGEDPRSQALRAAEILLASDPPGRVDLGAAVWIVAGQPEASSRLLSLAADRYVGTRAGRRRPNELLALLWYRAGRVAEGVREERKRLIRSNGELSRRLAAMEWGALEQGIQIDPASTRVGEPLRPHRGSLELSPPGSTDLNREGVAPGDGVEIHVFVVADDEPVGVLQIQTGELPPRIPFPPWVEESVPQRVEFVLGAVYPLGSFTSPNRIIYRDDFDWQQLAPLYSLKRAGASSARVPERNGDA